MKRGKKEEMIRQGLGSEGEGRRKGHAMEIPGARTDWNSGGLECVKLV